MTSGLSDIPSERIGSQLKFARNTLRLTLSDVSTKLGLPISTISDMEHGKRRVTSSELFKLSRLYGRQLDFFLSAGRSSDSFGMLMRSLDKDSVSPKTIIEFQELCHSYSFLRDLLKAPSMPAPPDYSKRQPNWIEAEEIAEAERSSLGLNGQPIKDICDLLEAKRGIKVFHLPENPERFFGAFASDDSCGACFLINSKNPFRRRAFTVAHEYGHCIAHRDRLALIDYQESFDEKDQDERFANAFAAAFLMPRGTVIEVLSQVKSSEQVPMASAVIHLANYFGVSFETAGWRLVSLRKLPVEKWRTILSQHIPSTPLARFLGYGLDEAQPETLPRQYKFLCYQAFEQKLISFERLAELLRRNFYELQSELEAAEE